VMRKLIILAVVCMPLHALGATQWAYIEHSSGMYYGSVLVGDDFGTYWHGKLPLGWTTVRPQRYQELVADNRRVCLLQVTPHNWNGKTVLRTSMDNVQGWCRSKGWSDNKTNAMLQDLKALPEIRLLQANTGGRVTPAPGGDKTVNITVIGFDVKGTRSEQQLMAIAAAGNGEYLPADKAADLSGVLHTAMQKSGVALVGGAPTDEWVARKLKRKAVASPPKGEAILTPFLLGGTIGLLLCIPLIVLARGRVRRSATR
jgi:hypothetical protein